MSEAVSAIDLAAYLDVTPSTIANLAAKERVVRLGRGRYDLKASIRRYCGHLQEAAAGRPSPNDELRTEKKRLTKLQADKAQADLDAINGSTVNVKVFEDRWATEMVKLRARLLAVSTGVAMALPHLTTHEVQKIDRVLRDAMTEVGGGDDDAG